MGSSNEIYRLFSAILFGITFSAVGCAATEVHKQGDSTAVIKQSGGSGPRTTEVIKTPDGQKIITRDGNNTDVTIQRGGASSSGKPSGNGTAKPKIDQDRFERGSRDYADCPPASETSPRDSKIPMAEEFKQSGGSDPSTTEVVKTPDDQEIITRNGRYTDDAVQKNGKSVRTGSSRNASTKAQIDQDNFGCGSRDCADCPSTGKTSTRDSDIPTAEEFKDRMRSRMRPPIP